MALSRRAQVRIRREHNIPTDSLSPKIYWLASLYAWSEIPNSKELRQIKSYVEFLASQYGPEVEAEILSKPLPARLGHDTTILKKGGWKRGWSYRKMSWGEKPFSPQKEEVLAGPLSLIDILDRCQAVNGAEPNTWSNWKESHRDTF
ncbi:MAG: hypothetical protein KBC81_00820 [Candidatus Pacebacteria bacterium]|nr:hypothetical protein [Candidatus Paceibacterota bacterium]